MAKKSTTPRGKSNDTSQSSASNPFRRLMLIGFFVFGGLWYYSYLSSNSAYDGNILPGLSPSNGAQRPVATTVPPQPAAPAERGTRENHGQLPPSVAPQPTAGTELPVPTGSPSAMGILPRQPKAYVVQYGDTIGSIANRFYGDVHKWRDIAQSNPYIDTFNLKQGTRLYLPPLERTQMTGEPAKPRDLTGSLTKRVVPTDPNGGTQPQALKTMPSGSSRATATNTNPTLGRRATPSTTTRTVTIKKGETLYAIADREYGSGKHWKKLYEANKGVLKDPESVKEGMKLVLP